MSGAFLVAAKVFKCSSVAYQLLSKVLISPHLQAEQTEVAEPNQKLSF